MKVYVAKADWLNIGTDLMIYDHDAQCGCWGENFYYVDFKKISKYWTLVGEL